MIVPVFLDQSALGLSAPPQDKLKAPPRVSLRLPQPRPRPPCSLSLGRKASPSPASSTPTLAVHSHTAARGALGEGRSDRDPRLGFPSRSAQSPRGRPRGCSASLFPASLSPRTSQTRQGRSGPPQGPPLTPLPGISFLQTLARRPPFLQLASPAQLIKRNSLD